MLCRLDMANVMTTDITLLYFREILESLISELLEKLTTLENCKNVQMVICSLPFIGNFL